MILNAVKSAEAARSILAGDAALTDEEKAYLEAVVAQGERARPAAEEFLRDKREQRERLEASRHEAAEKRRAERDKEIAAAGPVERRLLRRIHELEDRLERAEETWPTGERIGG